MEHVFDKLHEECGVFGIFRKGDGSAQMAKEAGVSELWLTHFSPAMPNPRQYLSEATAIFPNTRVGKDRMTKEFKFRDDNE